jgi:hypothetical protein
MARPIRLNAERQAKIVTLILGGCVALVRRCLSGDRKIRPMVAGRIRSLTPNH